MTKVAFTICNNHTEDLSFCCHCWFTQKQPYTSPVCSSPQHPASLERDRSVMFHAFRVTHTIRRVCWLQYWQSTWFVTHSTLSNHVTLFRRIVYVGGMCVWVCSAFFLLPLLPHHRQNNSQPPILDAFLHRIHHFEWRSYLEQVSWIVSQKPILSWTNIHTRLWILMMRFLDIKWIAG